MGSTYSSHCLTSATASGRPFRKMREVRSRVVPVLDVRLLVVVAMGVEVGAEEAFTIGLRHRVSVSSGSGSASLFPRPATSAPTCPVRGSPCAQRAQSSPHAGGSGLRARNLTASLARAARRDEDIEDLLIRLSSAGMRPPGARAACAPPAAWACRGWPPGPRGQRRLGARQLEPNRGANRTPNGRHRRKRALGGIFVRARERLREADAGHGPCRDRRDVPGRASAQALTR
jgi:hypothetical protein